MNKNICPACRKGELSAVVGPFSSRFIGRDGVERALEIPDLSRLTCNSCGEEVLNHAAVRKIEEAQRSATGLLTGDEIRDIRTQLEKTQAQMSELIGVGAKTYCRWESGASVQTVAFDNYLRIIRELPDAVRILSKLETQASGDVEDVQPFTPQFPSLDAKSASPDIERRVTQMVVQGFLHVAEPEAVLVGA